MKSPSRETIDLALKSLGVMAALFAIWQYFSETAAARRLEARRQSLSYVETYGAADLRAHRQTMFEFWLKHSDLVAVARKEGISESAYRAFFFTALEHDGAAKPMLNAIYVVSNFYDQLAFCRASDVCDGKIVDEYFCDSAKTFAATYGPISDSLAEMSGVADFGRGARELSKRCVSVAGNT